MDLDQQYEQIEAYLNNELSKEARTSFESKIKANSKLKEAVLSHVLANEALGLVIEDRIAGKLNKLAQQKIENSAPTRLQAWWKRPIAIAASLLLLAFTGLVFWANQNYSNQALLSANYAESTLPTVRSGEPNPPKFSEALLAFSNQNYSQVIAISSTFGQKDAYYQEVQYLLAHANWQEENYAAASTIFNTLLTESALPYNMDKQELEWNFLLSTLNSKGAKSEDFLQLLSSIQNNKQHSYHPKAQKLSKDLNSIWRFFTF